MKETHLICNAHLDPVWQWDWDEGISSALATFYSATKLLDEFDFIFCHNEALLYEYIEKYDKPLFDNIQRLVAEGKWHIMGGWYCQPDCLVPSGESFIRQITLGREYFKEKFNQEPTTAINFDSFGHSRGLVQILKKCGFDSYLFWRPMADAYWIKELPSREPFYWVGYDGSKIKALRTASYYASPLGKAKETILSKMADYEDIETSLVLWGVGNHGGVHSRKDLQNVADLISEQASQNEMIHSTPENYFAKITPQTNYNKELFVLVKSYSSVAKIKRMHDELENALYRTEKLCSYASLCGDYTYNKETFSYVERILAQTAFHDVLSGTAVKKGYLSTYRKIDAALEKLDEERLKAYYSLAGKLTPTKPLDDSFVAFNHHPYPIQYVFENELFNEENIPLDLRIYEDSGKEIKHQIVQQEAHIDNDRRIGLTFVAEIPAFSMKRFSIHKEKTEKMARFISESTEEDIIFKDSRKEVVISRKSGLITSYKVDGVEYVKGELLSPMIFDDNEDPWGWYSDRFGKNEKKITLDKTKKNLFANLDSVRVIEDGEIVKTVEAHFKVNESYLIVKYKLYYDMDHIDVNWKVLWKEEKKGLRLRSALKPKGRFFTGSAYGTSYFNKNGMELSMNRFVGNVYDDKALVVYNKSGVHSCSMKQNRLSMTLFNGSAYCAHPLDETTPIMPYKERYNEFIEVGEHDFHFRLCVNEMQENERIAKEFNEQLYTNLIYPHGNGTGELPVLSISDKNVVLSAFKKLKDDRYLLRLFNNEKGKKEAELKIGNCDIQLKFKAFEFNTLVYDGNSIVVSDRADLY